MTTPLPQGMRDRVMAAVKATPASSRSSFERRSLLLVLAGALGTFAVFAWFGGVNPGARSPTLMWVTAIGWAVAALVATMGSANRGGAMLGRATRTLLVLAGLAAPVIYAWVMGCTMAVDASGPATPWTTNVACLGTAMLLSLPPFAAFLLLRAGSDPVHPRALGAALGAAAGAWGGVFIDLHCPATHWIHVAFAHVLPIVAFLMLGGLMGKRALGVR